MEQEGRSFGYTRVKSSVIEAFEYDNDDEVLTIHFNSGSSYDYISVPFHVAEEMDEINSRGRSVGQFFNSDIKETYTWRKA